MTGERHLPEISISLKDYSIFRELRRESFRETLFKLKSKVSQCKDDQQDFPSLCNLYEILHVQKVMTETYFFHLKFSEKPKSGVTILKGITIKKDYNIFHIIRMSQGRLKR